MGNNFRYNRERLGRLSKWPLPVMNTSLMEGLPSLTISNLYRDEVVELTVHLSKKNIPYFVYYHVRYKIQIDWEALKTQNKTKAFIEVLVEFMEMLCGNHIKYETGDDVSLFFDPNHYRVKHITCPDSESARLALIYQMMVSLNEMLKKDLD